MGAVGLGFFCLGGLDVCFILCCEDVVGKIHLWFRDLARVEDYQIGSHPRGDARLLRVLHPPKGDGWVLPAKPAAFEDRITAVFDLDETLVHSSRLVSQKYGNVFVSCFFYKSLLFK